MTLVGIISPAFPEILLGIGSLLLLVLGLLINSEKCITDYALLLLIGVGCALFFNQKLVFFSRNVFKTLTLHGFIKSLL